MLVVDVNTLQTVNLLNFGNDIVLNSLLTVYRKNIARIDRTLGKRRTRLNGVALADSDFVAVGNGIVLLRACFWIGYYNVAYLLYFLHTYCSRNSGNNSRIFGTSALEQLLNTGKTLRDILRRSDTAGMERSHGKLGTRLTYRLSCDYADSFAHGNKISVGKVGTVALCAYSVLSLTVEHRAYSDPFNAAVNNLLSVRFVHELVMAHDKVACFRITEILHKVTSEKSFLERLDHLIAVPDGIDLNALVGTAVLLADNNLLGNVNKTSCKVTGVGGTQSGVGKTFTRASGGDEVLQNVKSLTVVCTDRHLDSGTRRVCDKSAHTRKLTHLVDRTSRSGVGHHKDRIIFVETVLKSSGNVVGGGVPYFDKTFGLLRGGDEASLVELVDLINLIVGLCKDILLCSRYLRIAYRNGNGGSCGELEAQSLYSVKYFRSSRCTVDTNTSFNNIGKLTLFNKEIHLQIKLLIGACSVNISQILRDILVEDYPAHCTVYQLGNSSAADIL